MRFLCGFRCGALIRFLIQCNVACGNGTQRRDIICVKRAGSDFTVVQAGECAHLDKPAPVQQCEMGECKPQWFTTEWSAVRERRPSVRGFHACGDRKRVTRQ